MHAQKAIVKSAKLYKGNYAEARLTDDPSKEDGRVVGWVLTHPDPGFFEEKLKRYD